MLVVRHIVPCAREAGKGVNDRVYAWRWTYHLREGLREVLLIFMLD